MTIETMETILGFTKTVASLENAVWFGSYFIWGVAFYILYKLRPLVFLKVLIWSEVSGLVLWLWINRFYFSPNLLMVTETSSNVQIVIISLLDMIIRIAPLILSTVGGAMGLCYLQNIWKAGKKTEDG